MMIMGKKTRQRHQILEEQEAKLQTIFKDGSQRLEVKQRAVQQPLIKPIKHFEDFFIRDPTGFTPRSYNRDKAFLELVRHVFVKYTPPKILANAFLTTNMTHWDWYVHVVQGGSFSKLMKEELTKREAHIFLTCRHEISINAAIVYAIAKAAGASDGNSLRIARTRLGTTPERFRARRVHISQTFDTCWYDVIRFFAVNPIETVQQGDDLIDYFRYMFTNQPTFKVFGAGHTIKSLVVKMIAWHHELARNKRIGGGQWEGMAIPNWSITRPSQHHNGDDVWTMKQIVTGDALAEEGTKQRHCVGSYKHACIDGHISIWSLRCNDLRCLTVEVRRNTYGYNDIAVVQARGLANRAPRGNELFVLQTWCHSHGIRYSAC